MKTTQRNAAVVLMAAMLAGLAGCADMSRRDRDTAIGAGVGAVGGALLTNSPLGAVGGAAVGGVIGNQIGKDRDRR